MSGQDLTIIRPCTAQESDTTTIDPLETKGTTIKRMIQNIIGIPTTTAQVSKGPTHFGMVKGNSIGIYSKEGTFGILFAYPAKGFVASAMLTDFVNALG